jgi:acetyl-CoA carboxylase biotin carboxyl carrier protein
MTSKPPFSTAELRQIAEWLDAARLHSIEICSPEQSVRIVASMGGRKPWGMAFEEMPVEAGGERIKCIRSTEIGVFLTTHPLRTAPFVGPGQHVKAGEIVGLLKTGEVFLPVLASCTGAVVRLAAAHGQAVDYGAGLIEIEQEESCA